MELRKKIKEDRIQEICDIYIGQSVKDNTPISEKDVAALSCSELVVLYYNTQLFIACYDYSKTETVRANKNMLMELIKKRVSEGTLYIIHTDTTDLPFLPENKAILAYTEKKFADEIVDSFNAEYIKQDVQFSVMEVSKSKESYWQKLIAAGINALAVDATKFTIEIDDLAESKTEYDNTEFCRLLIQYAQAIRLEIQADKIAIFQNAIIDNLNLNPTFIYGPVIKKGSNKYLTMYVNNIAVSETDNISNLKSKGFYDGCKKIIYNKKLTGIVLNPSREHIVIPREKLLETFSQLNIIVRLKNAIKTIGEQIEQSMVRFSRLFKTKILRWEHEIALTAVIILCANFFIALIVIICAEEMLVRENFARILAFFYFISIITVKHIKKNTKYNWKKIIGIYIPIFVISLVIAIIGNRNYLFKPTNTEEEEIVVGDETEETKIEEFDMDENMNQYFSEQEEALLKELYGDDYIVKGINERTPEIRSYTTEMSYKKGEITNNVFISEFARLCGSLPEGYLWMDESSLNEVLQSNRYQIEWECGTRKGDTNNIVGLFTIKVSQNATYEDCAAVFKALNPNCTFTYDSPGSIIMFSKKGSNHPKFQNGRCYNEILAKSDSGMEKNYVFNKVNDRIVCVFHQHDSNNDEHSFCFWEY